MNLSSRFEDQFRVQELVLSAGNSLLKKYIVTAIKDSVDKTNMLIQCENLEERACQIQRIICEKDCRE